MAGHGDIWYPTLPDRTCPVCRIPVKYEKGFYDQKPLYRCRECGYVIKRASEGKVIALICMAMFVVTIIAFFVGQVVQGVMPVPPGSTPQRTFFSPTPTPPGTVYSTQQ